MVIDAHPWRSTWRVNRQDVENGQWVVVSSLLAPFKRNYFLRTKSILNRFKTRPHWRQMVGSPWSSLITMKHNNKDKGLSLCLPKGTSGRSKIDSQKKNKDDKVKLDNIPIDSCKNALDCYSHRAYHGLTALADLTLATICYFPRPRSMGNAMQCAWHWEQNKIKNRTTNNPLPTHPGVALDLARTS